MRAITYCPCCGGYYQGKRLLDDRNLSEEQKDSACGGEVCRPCWNGPQYREERKLSSMGLAERVCGEDMVDQPAGYL